MLRGQKSLEHVQGERYQQETFRWEGHALAGEKQGQVRSEQVRHWAVQPTAVSTGPAGGAPRPVAPSGLQFHFYLW